MNRFSFLLGFALSFIAFSVPLHADECKDPSDSFRLKKSSKDFKVTLQVDCHCPNDQCVLKRYRLKVYDVKKKKSLYDEIIDKSKEGSFTLSVPNSTVTIDLDVSVDGEGVSVDGELIWGGQVRDSGSASAECEGDCGSGSGTSPRIAPGNIHEALLANHLKPKHLNVNVLQSLDHSIQLNIEVPESEQINIQIFSLAGQPIYQQTSYVLKGIYSKTIQLPNNILTGIYFINIRTEKEQVTKKVIIAN